VLGEVVLRAQCRWLPNMTVLQALSSAGFTQFAISRPLSMRVQDAADEIAVYTKMAIKGAGTSKISTTQKRGTQTLSPRLGKTRK